MGVKFVVAVDEAEEVAQRRQHALSAKQFVSDMQEDGRQSQLRFASLTQCGS